MRLYFISIGLLFLCMASIAQPVTKPLVGRSVDFAHGKLMVSENQRFLQHADGTPFFYLGDTAWELFHRLTYTQAETYLENRRAKGFTVIQAVILAELDGLNTPNMNGHKPLIDNDPTQPNEPYFMFVDSIIKLAESKGMYIGLLPTWGDKVDKKWGVGPEIFTPENAFTYGQYLGKRYKDFHNIIWINGGDRSGDADWEGNGNNKPVWEALAKGIRSEEQSHLMTFHPWGQISSSAWFHQSDWLDFNMAQTGHSHRTYSIYRIITEDYNKKPVKPTLDGEPRYEDHPIDWKPDSLGWFNEMHVRQAAYWNLFSGGLGHTYGCHPVWQMADPQWEFIGRARNFWYNVLDLPGAMQMLNVRRLMQSRPMLSRIPFQQIVINPGDEHSYIVAIQGDGYLMVYTPLGNNIELNGKRLDAQKYKLWWFDPRSGSSLEGGMVTKKNKMVFTPPSKGPGFDWVLVLDEDGRNFKAPGNID